MNQLILAAPDVDAQVFERTAEEIRPVGRRVTLYASRNDKALNLSKELQGGYRRAGDAEGSPLVVTGVDTIDASAVSTDFLGHSYYGGTRSVLADIFALLKSGAPPVDRFGLVPRGSEPALYWEFRP